MTELNSGLAVGLEEFLKPGMTERLDDLLTITLRFIVGKFAERRSPKSRFPGPEAAL
jgi:hypothetical protein